MFRLNVDAVDGLFTFVMAVAGENAIYIAQVIRSWGIFHAAHSLYQHSSHIFGTWKISKEPHNYQADRIGNCEGRGPDGCGSFGANRLPTTFDKKQ